MLPLETCFEFGPYRLLPAARLLLRAGQPVELTAKIFDLLVVLVEQRGALVERSFLMNMLWPATIVEEGNLTQCVFMLRKALGDAPDKTDKTAYVATVPGRGYRFVAPIRELTEKAAFSALAQPLLQPIALTTSLAVLPLKPLGEDPSAGVLGAGIADAVIVSLRKHGRLLVRPTTSVLKYAGSGTDPQSAGRELRVDLVLDGTLQFAGDRLRVSMHLVKVTSGVTLWAERFEAACNDVFAVQDAIAAQVAGALHLEMLEPKPRHHEARTENLEAYQLYIQWRYFWDKRSEAGLLRGLECARQLIQLDPHYAAGWVALADSCSLLAEYLFRAPQAMFPEAKEAALRALELDAESAEAHAALAEIHLYYDWDWAAAESAYKLALQRNPHDSAAYLFYGWLLLTQARFDEALKCLRQAQRLDPASLTLKTAMGLPHYYQRQYERAAEHYRQALEMDASFAQARYYLSEALIQQGRYDEALDHLGVYEARPPQQALTLAACAHARAGRTTEARRLLRQLVKASATQYISPYCLARIHTCLGNRKAAFAQLERGLQERAAWMVFLKVDPLLDELRADPRFARLLSQAGHLA